MLRKSILVISDQHAPYHHIDTLDFLSAIKEKYKPDCVVNIGDEMDWHSISFHDSHPGLYSPSHELVVAKKFFTDLGISNLNIYYEKYKKPLLIKNLGKHVGRDDGISHVQVR